MDQPEYEPVMKTERILTEELISTIEDGLRLQGVCLSIEDHQWAALERVLQKYERLAAFWKGFPTGTAISNMNKMAKKSQGLLKAIAAEIEAGHALIISDQLQPHNLEELISALTLLGDLEVKSPRAAGKSEIKSGWEKYLDQMAAEMQPDLERWWAEATGLRPTLKEDYSSPFSYFLAQIFPRLSFASKPLGASRTAVKKRRSLLEKR